MNATIDLLKKHNQEHLLAHLSALDEKSQQKLLGQIAQIDLDEYFETVLALDSVQTKPGKIEPQEVVRQQALDKSGMETLGAEAIRRGELCFFVVAGGQGSRLGFEHPKGMYPTAPITKKSLFQLHIEKIVGFGRYFGFAPHFFIMTSVTNHEETVSFLRENQFFGMKAENVHVFSQGNLPAVDLNNRLILSSSDELFLAPDGHGGSLKALKKNGMLEIMRQHGIRYISYFQIDNPLTVTCDPAFLGVHISSQSEVSTKVLPKRNAQEKVGAPVKINGKPAVIEYSDLPDELARQTDAQGNLLIGFGSIGIHIFDVNFVDRITTRDLKLPFHRANKSIPFYAPEQRKVVIPPAPNGKKMEQFVFDAIPMAERAVFFETVREIEFAPLKNKDGEDSVKTCQDGMTALFKRWFAAAGYDVSQAKVLEVSSLFACCEAEFCKKAKDYVSRLCGELYLG